LLSELLLEHLEFALEPELVYKLKLLDSAGGDSSVETVKRMRGVRAGSSPGEFLIEPFH
jgi:hypothetical protein